MAKAFEKLVDLVEKDAGPDWLEPLVDLVAQVYNGGFSQFYNNIGPEGILGSLVKASNSVPELKLLMSKVRAALKEIQSGTDDAEEEKAVDDYIDSSEFEKVLDKVLEKVQMGDMLAAAAVYDQLDRMGFSIGDFTLSELRKVCELIQKFLATGVTEFSKKPSVADFT